ncbi:uncharacterized protein LOC128681616 isoform X2 [Plodia interpunctella]|nr:uncharacterized protein LOC128681616 isoform X2 [Plodia interpunctella]
MVEHRTNYRAIENAYRSATKRQNIIDQIVVPKTQATIKYIQVELEEIDREESHRIKMTLNKMQKGMEAKRNCYCTKRISYVKDEDKKVEEINTELPKARSLIEEQTEIPEHKYHPVIIVKDMPDNVDRRSLIKLKSQQVIPSLKNFYELVSVDTSVELDKVIPKKRLSLGDCDPRLDPTMAAETSVAMDDFLDVCNDAKHQLDNLTNTEQPSQVDSKLIVNLKSHIDAVINTNSKLHNSTILAPSVKGFIQSCGRLDVGLKIANKDLDHTPLDDSGKKIVSNLVKNIDDVVQIITECKNNGLLTPSLEEFSKVFNEAKEKIGNKIKKPYHGLPKQDYLKQILADLETLTMEIRREGLESTKVQQFLKSCKLFKMRLEEHKKLVPKRRTSESQRDDSFITESILLFMMSCEDYVKSAKLGRNLTPESSSEEKIISKISELMVKWQREGILSNSTIEFMKNAKNRWTIDSSRKYNTSSDGRFILSPKDDSLISEDIRSIKMLPIPIKTIPKKITANQILPPSPENACDAESGETVNKTNDNPPLPTKSPKQPILSNKNIQKVSVAAGFVETQTNPLQSEKVDLTQQTLEPMPNNPPKCKEVEVYTESKCCRFSNETNVNFFTRNDVINDAQQSEMIVAEISAYDSCPVFESNHEDIWLLETCMEKPSDTEADGKQGSTLSTSNQSVEKLTCLVYDKEKSDDRSVKRTYTM